MKKKRDKLTLVKIAELANTSKSTVSRVLTNDPHVAPETRERVESVIEQYHYRPNLFARGLRGGRTGQIAVLGRWMERGFIAGVIRGIDEESRRNDIHLLNSFAHGPDDYIALWRRFAQGGQVDGVILIAPPAEILDRSVEPDDVPVVLCACKAADSRKGWKGVDSVTFDNVKAMDELLSHLVARGCTRLVHMQGSEDVYEAAVRAEAFRAFIERDPRLTGEIIQVSEHRSVARIKTLERLQDTAEWPDVFVCFNDDIAVGVIDAVKEKGLAIPRDVAVTGFDNSELAEFVDLTTVDVPSVLLGQEAVRLLCARLREAEPSQVARNTTISLDLRIRNSSLFRPGQGLNDTRPGL